MSNERLSRIAAALCLGGGVLIAASACAPKVGSDLWCYNLTNTPVGDWTGNQAIDFTKHCVVDAMTK